MDTESSRGGSYSADVRMELHVNGRVLSIGQLGPDFLILDHPVDLAPGDAEIAMSIDGRKQRWPVRLPDGIATGKPETRIALPE